MLSFIYCSIKNNILGKTVLMNKKANTPLKDNKKKCVDGIVA